MLTEELIDIKIKELYDSLMKKPLEILKIFNDFFGENRVDIQNIISLNTIKEYYKNTPIYKFAWNISKLNRILNSSNKNLDEIKLTDLSDSDIIEIFEFLKKQDNNQTLKCPFILVHFPNVRITNEYNKYIDITHLWAKIEINFNGTITSNKFTLNRSEYTISQFKNNYMHSHVSDIPKSDFTEFMYPCLGIGPIRNTISSLRYKYDADIWNLFCLELNKYVSTESTEGRPYKYLENIISFAKKITTTSVYPVIPANLYLLSYFKNELLDFVKYFINEKCLKFNYKNGSYSLGISFIQFMILISNKFIFWYNNKYIKSQKNYKTFETLLHNKILFRGIIKNNQLYMITDNSLSISDNLNNIKICTFKGKDVMLNIIDDSLEECRNALTFLNHKIALCILTTILNILNYQYGKNSNNTNNWYL